MRRWTAVLISVMALTVAITALILNLAASRSAPGRVVEAGTPASYRAREPVQFTLDHFYLMPLDEQHFVALYIYPPGYFGHVRGCVIRWEPEATATREPSDVVTGLWVDPCGGSRWDASGAWLSGPAGRNLDRFPTRIASDGRIQIDTRTLECSDQPCERVPSE